MHRPTEVARADQLRGKTRIQVGRHREAGRVAAAAEGDPVARPGAWQQPQTLLVLLATRLVRGGSPRHFAAEIHSAALRLPIGGSAQVRGDAGRRLARLRCPAWRRAAEGRASAGSGRRKSEALLVRRTAPRRLHGQADHRALRLPRDDRRAELHPVGQTLGGRQARRDDDDEQQDEALHVCSAYRSLCGPDLRVPGRRHQVR